jgi:branched-chain amino acid transport system ATP-binding protein
VKTVVTLLAVEELTVKFGGLLAVNELSFTVAAGAIHGLIGPNGAGKSTVFNCLSRFYNPAAGRISFDGRNLLNAPPHGVVKAGIARTFQNVELFRGMTVLENVLVGQHSTFDGGFLRDMFATASARVQEREKREAALAALELLDMTDAANVYVGSLPYGKQKKVEFARALAAKPKLLLLDEPAAGLNPQETYTLGELIIDLGRKLGITVLLVEHDMTLVMSICDQITVMEFGRKIASGRPDEIRCDQAVIKAYLGEGEDIA